jgi:hypothetical protein
MTNILLWVLIWLLIALVCALAWLRGSAPERWGAGIVLAGAVYGLVVNWLHPDAISFLLLAGEGAMGMGFLMLALRYTSAWLGGAMIFQAVQFSLHAYYLIAAKPHDYLYAVVNNVDTLAVLACILTGTVITWRNTVAAR